MHCLYAPKLLEFRQRWGCHREKQVVFAEIHGVLPQAVKQDDSYSVKLNKKNVLQSLNIVDTLLFWLHWNS